MGLPELGFGCALRRIWVLDFLSLFVAAVEQYSAALSTSISNKSRPELISIYLMAIRRFGGWRPFGRLVVN
jgi:hypothetical protein